ncbi:MAG: LytS/YhcK type 5TM receptor domain-containing protein [Bacillota bacterium]|nr:LytS/YhcK type 5TM receptor domain-containing protein [Bacillota bacterium]MDD3298620.1 LytS/YhcK type 5TM receptor domain-containing protein [Bacillota bacterium]MDD3851121.1 LytS/YhcK type 5TM receptor domain-containing protein [Bacillota bacterium]MDD4707573.1 LytS/YhcK type 5TM receptor domain-containing protein [Bacillota bacterium]
MASVIMEVVGNLANKLGIIIMLVFFLSRISVFKKLILKKVISPYERILLALIFGGIGILGTYFGVPIMGSIANSRIIAVMIAGILGGPVVGIGAGLIAGIHRWAINIGGFTAVACGISTVIQGGIGGYLHRRSGNKTINYRYPLTAVIAAEMLEMMMILLLASPLSVAIEVVKIIFIPMTVINSIGMVVSILFINNIFGEQEKTAAMNAQLALNIANKTLPFLRKGLNNLSAAKTTKIILSMTDIDGVSITDTKKVLSFYGSISTNLVTDRPIDNTAILDAITKGENNTVSTLGPDGRAQTIIAVPLKERNVIVGSLVLFKQGRGSIGWVEEELAFGLAQLFSTQLELSKIEEQSRLLAKAELQALQAQINPHFLFNALNTIVSYCRISPGTARKLLIDLGDILRNNLGHNGENIDLYTEIKNIKSYLNIEKARFGSRLNVKFEIQEDINCHIPPLLLQPLVENSIKHGLAPKEEGGTVVIGVTGGEGGIHIYVQDDGVGFDIESVLEQEGSGPHKKIGLKNIDKRLKNMYGNDYGLKIESHKGKGTHISMFIPNYSEGYVPMAAEEVIV